MTLRAALYRAGRNEEAIRRLMELDAPGDAETDRSYMFRLAMCHARQGRIAEARHWLERGAQWLDQPLQRKPDDPAAPPLEWDQRWWLPRLRAEAERVVAGSRRP